MPAMPGTSSAQVQTKPKSVTQDRSAAVKKELGFEISFPSSVQTKPISGRVYVMLGPESSNAEPRLGPDWFRPQPFFARDVKDWKPGRSIRIDARSDGFPEPLDKLPPGRYAIQAVVRLNPDTHRIGNGEGNAFGPVVRARLDPAQASTVALKVDQIVPPRKFEETERIRLVEVESPLLSAFHKRPIRHRAAVILPEPKPQHKLPTVYIIPGFGGDHHMASTFASSPRMQFGKDMVRIILDPDCGTGHHVFADSLNNGPRGRALVEEFIPHLERTFPLITDQRARLLNGHSSGGWSSLWLQVTYPDVFGGTWSTSPDPVDFRDFQRINIYAPGENMFKDRKGETRPIARMGVIPVIFYDRFSRMEEVIGQGGQLGSFEAVFSPRGPDGMPGKLWNRADGVIDPAVAKAWEPYDIRLVLERNWPSLSKKLAGKIRVITGGKDTFYLEGAAELLKESLAKLGSDAVIEIVPNRDHGTILDPNLSHRIDAEMKAAVAPILESK